MKKRIEALSSTSSLDCLGNSALSASRFKEISLDHDFWVPPSNEQIAKDSEEFARRFGLFPELADFLGLRWALREDTLKNVH
jgi:hypothetical protein